MRGGTMTLSACYFCHGHRGLCKCAWAPSDSSDGFDSGGTWITNPGISSCGRFFVDPNVTYGRAYRRWVCRRLAPGTLVTFQCPDRPSPTGFYVVALLSARDGLVTVQGKGGRFVTTG